MVLSKREQIIMGAAVGVLGLLVLDRFVVNPAMNRLEEVETRKAELAVAVGTMEDLLDRRPVLKQRWQEMLEAGLTDDPSVAEGCMYHALQAWSRQSRVSLTSVTPQRSVTDRTFGQIVFTVVARGDMESVARFLWAVEQTPMPVRIQSLRVGSTNTSGQALSLTAKFSFLYLSPASRSEEERI